MHSDLCDLEVAGGAGVRVDHRNVQRGLKWGPAVRAFVHRIHGTRTDGSGGSKRIGHTPVGICNRVCSLT